MRALASDPQIHSRRVRIQAIGKLDLLPRSTVAAIEAARDATAGYSGMVLTVAVAYGGRAEIVDAVRALRNAEKQSGATLDEAIAYISVEAISGHPCMADRSFRSQADVHALFVGGVSM